MAEFIEIFEDLLGVKKLFDGDDFVTLLLRLSINLFFATVVIRWVYARIYAQRDYVFTYFLFNVITFALCFLLRKVPIELGFALGLFAVFGILRYRTEPIRIRDLTYLFIVIGIAILNAVSNKKISLVELLAVNTIIVGTAVVLEWAPFVGRESSQTVLYDNLELLKLEDDALMLADLSERTGLPVKRIAIHEIDLLRDVARLTVYYRRK